MGFFNRKKAKSTDDIVDLKTKIKEKPPEVCENDGLLYLGIVVDVFKHYSNVLDQRKLYVKYVRKETFGRGYDMYHELCDIEVKYDNKLLYTGKFKYNIMHMFELDSFISMTFFPIFQELAEKNPTLIVKAEMRRKRLDHFRKRYGPHIKMEDIPKGSYNY